MEIVNIKFGKIVQGQITSPSSDIINNIEVNALELARIMGKGITLKIDVINNKERKNCDVFLEKFRLNE